MSLDHEKIKANAIIVEKGARILMQGCQNKAIMIGDTQAKDMNAAMLVMLTEIQQEAGKVAIFYQVLFSTPKDLLDLDGIEQLAKDAMASFANLNGLLHESIVPFAEDYNKENPQTPKETLLGEMLDRIGQARCELAKLQQLYKWLHQAEAPSGDPWSTSGVSDGERAILRQLADIQQLIAKQIEVMSTIAGGLNAIKNNLP